MFRTFGCLTYLILVAATAASAQTRSRGAADCNDVSGDRAYHCEMREETLSGGNPLDVDARPNGGIRVQGWDRSDVALRARIVGYADSEDEARRVASQVQIETGGGKIRATGPERQDDSYWTVSFELSVPHNSQLALRTVNGGIDIRNLRGNVTFRATNGGVRIENAAGEIRGETNNGGLTIDLSGDRWDGTGLDVETHNGGVNLTMPANYSAELETGTTNGRVRLDFPVTVQGLIGKHINTVLGGGGPKIRAMTYNGGVRVTKAER